MFLSPIIILLTSSSVGTLSHLESGSDTMWYPGLLSPRILRKVDFPAATVRVYNCACALVT